MAVMASFLSPPLFVLAFTTALRADRNETKGSLAFLAASRWAMAFAIGPILVGSFAMPFVAKTMLNMNNQMGLIEASFIRGTFWFG
jgi:hypothetical protein